MKQIKIFLTLLLVLFSSMACNDDFSVDLSGRQFVRLNKTSVSITPGEKYVINAVTDSLGGASKTFKWTILDSDIASIESLDNQTAIITGLSEGTSVIRIESTDGALKYFADLTVGKERVFKILTIGNSFSEDAVENYLYDLAIAAGHKVMIGNMYIGGQSLEGHWKNVSENNPAYQLRLISPDGSKNSFNDQAIMDALTRENWDFISFQEVSQLSGVFDGYLEYLPKLVEYAKSYTTNPEIKYILHQTWAYAKDSSHSGFPTYDNDQMKMYDAIVETAWKAKEITDIDMIVPVGTAIQNGRTSYIGDKFTRDGYHLNLGIGRFTAASTWFEALFGGIRENPFEPDAMLKFDVQLVKTAAYHAVSNPKQVTELEDFKEPGPNEFILQAPLFIDFGPDESPAPFNNFKSPNDVKLGGLKDINGANSNFAIEVLESFSGTLSRGLENVLGLPKTASQDMFFTDGIRIPQSSLTLSNLNKDLKYTLVLYGSINDNNTETEFNVVGKNQKAGLLDNDNNLGKIVVMEGIEPADDATITIKMKPGPNNTQFAKFFGINAMILLPDGMEVPVQKSTFELEQPVYVDFGILQASASFNHFPANDNAAYLNLPDANAVNTGIAMTITARFTNRNESGEMSTTIGFPKEVCQDAFYGDKNTPVSGFTIFNLNPDKKYRFVFYGSRRDVNDSRETKYEVIGSNTGFGLLETSKNKSEVAIVDGIQPTEFGIIDIRISAGPNNNNPDGFYYINAMIVSPEGFVLHGM